MTTATGLGGNVVASLLYDLAKPEQDDAAREGVIYDGLEQGHRCLIEVVGACGRNSPINSILDFRRRGLEI